MDRIDTPAPKGIVPGLRAQGAARASSTAPAQAKAAVDEASAVPVSSVASAGVEPPIDQERVDEIRRAVEAGRYPVVPTRIADAMIAAGFLLRVGE